MYWYVIDLYSKCQHCQHCKLIFGYAIPIDLRRHWRHVNTPETGFLNAVAIQFNINKDRHCSLQVNLSRCHYTKSNPIDDHSNICSKTLQKQNFKPLGHYTCMQCGTSHLQKVQENILSHIILATYRKFTVATVRFTQNVSCNIFTHPIYQQVANVTV